MANSANIPIGLVESVLDQIPGAPFFIQDANLRFRSVNAAMVELCGARHRGEVIGKSTSDFFPDPAQQRWETRDREVIRSNAPLRDRLEFRHRTKGKPVWLLTNRWPLVSPEGEAIGVTAISRVLPSSERRHPIYERVKGVIEYLRANFASPVDIAELARSAGVSVSQLERDFVQLLGLPPRRYLTKVRFEAALDMLKAGESIAQVAHACGYADQSAFTRRFRAAVGMAPSEYRRMNAGSTDLDL